MRHLDRVVFIAGVYAVLLLALAPAGSYQALADDDDDDTPAPPTLRATATPLLAPVLRRTPRPTPTRVAATRTPPPAPTDTPVPALPTSTPTRPPASQPAPTSTPRPALVLPVPVATATATPSTPSRAAPARRKPTATPTIAAAPEPAPAQPKTVFVAPAQPVPVEPVVAAPDPSLMVVDALQFGAEFDGLRAAPGLDLGVPLTGEEPVADAADDPCDLGQLTTTGLVYWRCSSATANFVANDGLHHWALLGGQFVEWVGPTIDPPMDAMPAELPPLVNLVCLGPNDSPQDACIVADGTTTEGFIDDPGGSSVYAFQVNVPLSQVHADLTNLPADYDLYLVDGSGNLLAQSVQEDTQPEAIDAPLTPGAYLLYVHSDPGRAIDPDNPFVLHLDMQPLAADSGELAGP